ncbi:choline/ethanolamine kinase family protein [Bacterioplanoides sp.]|uniref:choline/ethanolamine kinase family protein n=1 Tax=Bacterioplanoides sp. TaxID=2066072 RepID=UPI003B002DCC
MSTSSIDLRSILDDWPRWNITTSRPDVSQFEKIPAGLTNQNYILHLEHGRYVIRFDALNSDELDINRDAEYHIHQMVVEAGLVSPVIYRHPTTPRYWIRQYMAGQPLSAEALNQTQLNQIISVLKTLHQIQPDYPLPTLSLVDKAQQYIDIIHQSSEVSPALEEAFNRLLLILKAAPDQTPCLCHMDAMLSNWISTEQGLQLMDWEYAGLGHPLWDLATVSIDAQLNKQQQQYMLQQYYVNKPWSQDGWQLAKQQISGLAALWYGAQGLWPLEKVSDELTAL